MLIIYTDTQLKNLHHQSKVAKIHFQHYPCIFMKASLVVFLVNFCSFTHVAYTRGLHTWLTHVVYTRGLRTWFTYHDTILSITSKSIFTMAFITAECVHTSSSVLIVTNCRLSVRTLIDVHTPVNKMIIYKLVDKSWRGQCVCA